MPYRRRFSVKMQDFEDDVTVVDVYDLASDIGKECEIIIEKYGPDAVTALLPKVINALELLENLAVRNEKENQALQELTAKISQLENDKIEKAEYRQRFEKEIEAIEEQWRSESAELVTAVARLQDENKRLRRTINTPADGTSAPPSPAREHDQEVLSRLSSTAEKQRATLRLQEVQLQEKQHHLDSLTNQVEKLAQVSRDLRRKHKQLQNQMRLVCEERTELTAIVQSQQKDIATLQQADAQNKKCASCGAATPDALDDEDQCAKPTFSVRELRAILHERNELKLKLNRAEEQLQALQVEPQPDSSSDTSPSVSTTAVEEEEPPVQGPLPAEPEDAPWKRNSGIRKFTMRVRMAGSGWRCRHAAKEGGRPRRGSLSALGTDSDDLEVLGVFVFASSLLSLISPWARSPGARCRRSALALVRCPRPVDPPPPPLPPPRRHSDPSSPSRIHRANSSPAQQKRRRHSEIKDPQSKLDLRQELQNLNLNNQEVNKWLGNKFEEKDEDELVNDDVFAHDLPLQRSISLDGGIDIFNYLQTIGSEWSASSVGSSWTVHSVERENLVFEQYRSFEDIPASQIKVKSRRASSGIDNAFYGRNLAFSILKDSYKGMDTGSGSISPQIKKLQRCFTVTGSFDDFKQAVKSSPEKKSAKLERVSSGPSVSTVGTYFQMNSWRRSISLRNSVEAFVDNSEQMESDDDKDCLEIRVPFYRTLSFEKKDQGERKNTRQRKVGVFDSSFQGNKVMSLRNEVMKKNVFKSSENIMGLRRKANRRGSSDSNMELSSSGAEHLRGIYRNINSGSDRNSTNLFKLEKTFHNVSTVPTIVVTNDRSVDTSVAKTENRISTITSDSVELSRNCDCRICTDVGTDEKCFMRKLLSRLFVKIVTCREYGRKLTYWDENNNLNESEMYKCIMDILKLMLGLWLRHLDHN